MATDTSEGGLERLICTALTGAPCNPGAAPSDAVHERPANYGACWICGDPNEYEREYFVDLAQLRALLNTTQPKVTEALALVEDGKKWRSGIVTMGHDHVHWGPEGPLGALWRLIR